MSSGECCTLPKYFGNCRHSRMILMVFGFGASVCNMKVYFEVATVEFFNSSQVSKQHSAHYFLFISYVISFDTRAISATKSVKSYLSRRDSPSMPPPPQYQFLFCHIQDNTQNKYLSDVVLAAQKVYKQMNPQFQAITGRSTTRKLYLTVVTYPAQQSE